VWTEEIVAGRPAWRHAPSGVAFRRVPGGTFLMAADIYPWQGCDEWLLLLSATRYEHSEFTAVRP
jgi:hypothetical protein